MKDNPLSLADWRTDAKPMTIEGALLKGQPPLVNCSHGVDKIIFMRRVLAIAREYLVDYDLVRAAARAGIEWELVQYFDRDPTFICALDMMRKELKPEEVITRTEVIEMLKHEACTAAKSRDRIAAAQALARIAGFTIGEDGGSKGGVPTINITFNNGAPGEKPMINVTATRAVPEALL